MATKTGKKLKTFLMAELGRIIAKALEHSDDASRLRLLREETLDLADRFPVYPGILRRLYEQERSAYE